MNPDQSAKFATALDALVALRQCADDACQAAYHANIKGPINWGDLGCTEAVLSADEFGAPMLCVMIEEVDPTCPELHEFVSAYLEKRGWSGVTVFTEW